MTFAYLSNVRVNSVFHEKGKFHDESGRIPQFKLWTDDASVSEKGVRKSRSYMITPANIDSFAAHLNEKLVQNIIKLSRMIATEDGKSLSLDDALAPHYQAISGISTGNVSNNGNPLTTVLTIPEIIDRQSHSGKRIEVNHYATGGYTDVNLFPGVRAAYNFSGEAFVEKEDCEELEDDLDEEERKAVSRKYRINLRSPAAEQVSFDFRGNTLDFSKDEGDIELYFFRGEHDEIFADESLTLPKIITRKGQNFKVSFSSFIPDAVGILAIENKVKSNGGTVEFDKYDDFYLGMVVSFDNKYCVKKPSSLMKMFINVAPDDVHGLIERHTDRLRSLYDVLTKKNFEDGNSLFLRSVGARIVHLNTALEDGVFEKLHKKHGKKKVDEGELTFNGNREPVSSSERLYFMIRKSIKNA